MWLHYIPLALVTIAFATTAKPQGGTNMDLLDGAAVMVGTTTIPPAANSTTEPSNEAVIDDAATTIGPDSISSEMECLDEDGNIQNNSRRGSAICIPNEFDVAQGDILMPIDVLPEDVMVDESKVHTPSRKKGFGRLWPGGADGWPEVPYRILNSSQEYSIPIHKGLAHWEKHTCIKFKHVNDTYVGPHLKFYKGKGCNSQFGRQRNAKGQLVSIGKGCQYVGTVVHEVGHAFGFAHEHSRSDRGESIKVLLENVEEKNYKQFNMVKSRNKVPYDFTSVMQYGIYMFSNNGKPTMVTRDPYDIRHIRKKRQVLSFRDAKETNLAYHCIAKWSEQFPDAPECQNEGYIGSTGACICPRGTEGEFCEKVVGHYFPELECGRNITVSTTIQPIVPTNPSQATRCMWWIQAPECHNVRLTVLEFKMKKPCNKYSNFFELRTDDPILPGTQYCDTGLAPRQELLSVDQDMFINFHGKLKASTFKFTVDFVRQENCSDLDWGFPRQISQNLFKK